MSSYNFCPRFRRCRWFVYFLLPIIAAGFAGCGRFSPHPHKEYVYVSAQQTYLRDRLAAVTNRVADVKNGQRLQVLGEDRRFYHVKTDSGAVGWIDDLVVIDQPTYDQFEKQAADHAHDPVVATGILRDESNLHLTPGRKSMHFHVLPENMRVQLLVRASVPKALPPQAVPVALPTPSRKKSAKAKKVGKDVNAPPYVPPGPPMEDWWLVRGPQGQTGWVLSRMMDIDIPQDIDGLAGTQRYVAAYKLGTMEDPESKFVGGQVPEYIAVTNAWNNGLPYDFDQVHVFTWDLKRHRYELAFRERGVEGYLPVTIGSGVFNGRTEPTFSFKRAANNEAVEIDPATGAAKADATLTETYRLEGALVYKVGPVEPKAKPTSQNRDPSLRSGQAVGHPHSREKRRVRRRRG